MSTKKRPYDFTAKVERTISARAGYKCSFAGCRRLLVGPGEGKASVANLGEIGHVHSGSTAGPRYDSTLSLQQLRSDQNGILLCRHHHKLVDSLTSTFSVPELLRMKNRHEYNVSVELGVLVYPAVWIDSIIFDQFDLFNKGTTIQLGRVNHMFGESGLGKTAILEVLNTILTGTLDPRWADTSIEAHVRISTNERSDILTRTIINNGTIRYSAGNRQKGDIHFTPSGMLS